MNHQRRIAVLRMAAAAAGPLLAAAAQAQGTQAGGAQTNWPTRPVRLIIPYGTGGSTDALGRVLAAKLPELLGQPIVVENRPGANAAIGTAELARSPADGYTFCMVSSSHVVNPFVSKDIPYNVRRDFAPVTTLARMSSIVVVHPSVPARNMKELVELIRQKPDQYFYGIAGGLSNGHVMMERLKHDAGLKVTPVMYKGAGPAVLELVSGRIQIMISAPPPVKPFIEQGKLHVLASTGSRNPIGFNNLPSLVDEGYNQLESYEWLGLITRAGTPKAIVDRMNAALSTALKDPAIVKLLNGQSMEVVADAPETMGRFIDTELDKFSKLVTTLDLKE